MIEAVGPRYLGAYFRKLERLLKPNGICVVQAITIPENRYDAYTKGCDWIQRYIFPGGHLPCLAAMQDVLKKETDLYIERWKI